MGEVQQLEEQLDQLREELETMQDDYEDKMDTLTTQFEDKIDALEDLRDQNDTEIDNLKGEITKLKNDHALTIRELEEAHTKELEDLRYALATNGAEWIKEVDEEGNEFYRNSITGETRWEDPTPLSAAGKAALEKLEELEPELKKFQKKAKKAKVREKAMVNELDKAKRVITEKENEGEILNLKLQEKEANEGVLLNQHQVDLERKREEKETALMQHEETRMRQVEEARQIKHRLAKARREAKGIIDELKDDISGMYEMQKRAMGLGGRRGGARKAK
jgi:hypothetical protein|eukprot:g562.t1